MYFQYKLLNRIINCNKKLNDWKILPTATCNFCPNIDDLNHFFIHCAPVKLFWTAFYGWFSRCNHTQVCFPNDQTILFGYSAQDDLHIVLNYCTLYAKYFIYKQRLYGNNAMYIQDFLNELKYNVQVEKMCTVKTPEKFYKFENIYNALNI